MRYNSFLNSKHEIKVWPSGMDYPIKIGTEKIEPDTYGFMYINKRYVFLTSVCHTVSSSFARVVKLLDTFFPLHL